MKKVEWGGRGIGATEATVNQMVDLLVPEPHRPVLISCTTLQRAKEIRLRVQRKLQEFGIIHADIRVHGDQ